MAIGVTGSRILGGRYELAELVGSGGMADVFRAADNVLGRSVAVKVLRSDGGGAEERERFTTEAHTLATLNHPGLVTLFDAGIDAEHPYLVMEYVEGASLAQLIREGGPLDPALTAALVGQVADALAYAHRQGVVHRDVKPGNILVAEEQRALLTDFGIARLLVAGAHHTRTGETIGSPAYLSPEQVSGEPLTEAVDVYSLGLVLLEALTGRRAYPGTPLEAAVARLSAAPAIPTSLNADWRELLSRMTRRDPAERPTAVEVAATLNSSFEEAVRTSPVVALDADTGAFEVAGIVGASDGHEPTVVGLPLRQDRPSRTWSGVLWVASAVALGALLVALVLAGRNTPEPVDRPPQEIPAEVPEPARAPLENLHRAVEEALR